MSSPTSALLQLEEAEINRLFDPGEISYILKQRKHYGCTAPHKLKTTKSQLLRYLGLEMEILKLISFRVHLLKEDITKLELEKGIVERANGLFELVSHYFRHDCRPWIWFTNFCKKLKVRHCFRNMIESLVRAHSDKPRAWKLAARWEFEENRSIHQAREYILRGLRILPYSSVLYKEAFRLELDFANLIRKQLGEIRLSNMFSVSLTSCSDESCILLKTAIDMPADRFRLIISGGLAQVVYQVACTKIPEAEFIIDLLKVTHKYDFVSHLQHQMIRKLCSRYSDCEATWDTVARCELRGMRCFPGPFADASLVTKDPVTKHSRLRQRMRRCVAVYHYAVKALPTKHMYTFYLNSLMKFAQVEMTLPKLPKIKASLLHSGFAEAHSAGLMDDKFYLHWVRFAAVGQRKRFGYVLKVASERLPTNVGLWQMRLAYSMARGGEDEAVRVFQQALKSMKDETGSLLCVWTAVLEQGLSDGKRIVEKLFREGMKPSSPLAWHLRPMFLEWLASMRGIQAARDAYETMRSEQPTYLQIHYSMAELELAQPTLDLERVRRCYELAIAQYGSHCPDAWAQYAKLELMRGDLQSTYEIQRRALEALGPLYSDEFISKYSFLRSSIAVPHISGSSESIQE